MQGLETKSSMESLYKKIGKSRQAIWKAKQQLDHKQLEEEWILRQVAALREDHPGMGSRILFYTMKEYGIELPIGVNKFERLLSCKGLTVGTSKRKFPLTSDGLGSRTHPNLTNGLTINNINQLVVADITYFPIATNRFYLFTFKDVYSQRLISLIPSETLEASNALEALNEYKNLRGVHRLKGCIHHSDNGSQYDSKMYKEYLLAHEMLISRSKASVQNGSSEQINHIIKNMYLRHMGITNFEHLKSTCKKVKLLMNEKRSIKQLGNMTVAKFEQTIMKQSEEDNRKKTMYDFDSET